MGASNLIVEGNFRSPVTRNGTLLRGMPHRPREETERSQEGGNTGYQLGVRLFDSGEIYEAYHPRHSEDFVIKLFRRAAAESSTTVRAFSREAGRVSILTHPHIAQVFDSGLLADHIPFAAVERLSGLTLEDHLVRRGQLSTSAVLSVIRGIVSGLSAAHSAGIVHREIRPDNVFLVDGVQEDPGFVKLLDFGVSRLTWGERTMGRGISVAASRYLAPEQTRGDLADVDARTDQFAVAAIAYRLLTGNEPFPGYTAGAGGAYPMPRPVIASIGARSPVDVVLFKALCVRSTDRFRSVAVFYEAFEQALANAAPLVAPHVAPLVAPLVMDDRQDRSVAQPRAIADVGEPEFEREADFDLDELDRVPKRRGPFTMFALAMLATVAVAAFVLGKQGWRPPAVWRQVNIPLTLLTLGSAGQGNSSDSTPEGRSSPTRVTTDDNPVSGPTGPQMHPNAEPSGQAPVLPRR
jgi:serine/threonine protein kinase